MWCSCSGLAGYGCRSSGVVTRPYDGQAQLPGGARESEGGVVVEPARHPPVVLISDLLEVFGPHPHVHARPQDLLADEPRDVSMPLAVLVAFPGQQERVPAGTLEADDRREPCPFPHNSNILASMCVAGEIAEPAQPVSYRSDHRVLDG
jgi:hypothetical protein